MSSHNPNLDQPTEPTDSAEARMRLALGLGTRPANAGSPSATTGQAPPSHDSVRQRRRFAQDGDVPVVILHRGRDSETGGENKLASLTTDLREERAARSKAERALEDANLVINSLKTKLKHAEMSLEEKLHSENDARAQMEALLTTEREARQQAEGRAAEAVLALSMLERKMQTGATPTSLPPTAVEAARAAPAPDLFADLDASAASPAAPKRRMSRKSAAQGEPSPVAVAAERVPEPAVDGEDQPIEWWLPSFRAARKTQVRRKRA